MKRSFCFLLILSLLIIPGCAKESPEETLSFYYCRKEFAYGTETGIIVPEQRSLPGHEDDLEYLLHMYVEGPLDDSLVSPFPKGTLLQGFTYSDATLYVTLNEPFAQLDGIDHTIAAACIAYTGFDLTPAEKVVIKCNSQRYGNKSITLYRDSVLFRDDSIAPDPTQPPQ